MKILGILLLIISIEEILVKDNDDDDDDDDDDFDYVDCDPSVSDCKKCYYSLSCYKCDTGF